jgi:18S rRNA (guanine1575-N7)-methyltransferase
MKGGLAGGLYIDYPNSSTAKKYYLVLSTQIEGKLGVIENKPGLEEESAQEIQRQKKKLRKSNKFQSKSKVWIFKKKEAQRSQGREVRPDTKYTGRRRKVYFS